MTNSAGFTRLALVAFPLLCCVAFIAAAPIPPESPEELVRRANAAFRAGEIDAAEQLYTAAEERTRDPGLVAFNRAALLFEQGNFREAERHYDRVLDDAACPPVRAAKAWYNRGTCLLRRGGSMSVYRSAIACFENTLDSPAADEPLKADARHNLELAKLLWLEEIKKEQPKEPPSPNDNPPPEEDKQPRKTETGKQPGELDAHPIPGKNGDVPKDTSQMPDKKDNGTQTTPGDQTVPANNANLQIPKDTDEVQNYSPEEARAYLKKTAERRKRELHSLLRTLYGPDRVDVRDW